MFSFTYVVKPNIDQEIGDGLYMSLPFTAVSGMVYSIGVYHMNWDCFYQFKGRICSTDPACCGVSTCFNQQKKIWWGYVLYKTDGKLTRRHECLFVSSHAETVNCSQLFFSDHHPRWERTPHPWNLMKPKQPPNWNMDHPLVGQCWSCLDHPFGVS